MHYSNVPKPSKRENSNNYNGKYVFHDNDFNVCVMGFCEIIYVK